jgi:rfaE bifunctional protein kinase chain/domain
VKRIESTKADTTCHGRLDQIEAALERFQSLRVLVIGDLLLDDYRVGDVERISPEAPVPIVHVQSERTELGGAGNVARGIIALGAECALVGMAGLDPEGDRSVELLDQLGIPREGIVRTPDRVTTQKIRVVARGQQMLRLDREEQGPVSVDHSEALREAVSRLLPAADVVVLQDYDKGVFGDGLGEWAIGLARQQGIRIVADPKRDLMRFRGASLIKPNFDEARGFMAGVRTDFEGRRVLVEKIQRELGGGEVVLTRGAAGMTALDREGCMTDVPTRRAEVFDVQGAGDTSIAALALCRAAEASLVESCIVANAAAAVSVEKVGTAVVDLMELRRQLPAVLSAFEGAT